MEVPKMKKHRTNRILALLLVLVMTLSLFPADAFNEQISGFEQLAWARSAVAEIAFRFCTKV